MTGFDGLDFERIGGGTLKRIEEGGEALLHLALTRCEEVTEALRAGDFVRAHRRATELHEKVSILATAQVQMGQFRANTTLIRAHQLTEGMFLCHIGIVTSVSRTNDKHPSTGEEDIQVYVECRPPYEDSEPFEKTWQWSHDQELLIWTPGSEEAAEREAISDDPTSDEAL